jgi:hypothetical protein
VPAHDGGGLDEHEDVAPPGPRTRQRDPEEPVGPSEGRARAPAPKNGKLLAEGEILEDERAAGTERGPGYGKYGQQEREQRGDLSVRATPRPPRKRQRSRVDRIVAKDSVAVEIFVAAVTGRKDVRDARRRLGHRRLALIERTK